MICIVGCLGLLVGNRDSKRVQNVVLVVSVWNMPSLGEQQDTGDIYES